MPTYEVANVIDGKKRHGETDDVIQVFDPSTATVIVEFAAAGDADVETAVASAHDAAPKWASLTVGQRAQLLTRLADLVDEHADEFINMERVDAGKPVTAFRYDEFPGVMDSFRFFVEAGRVAVGSSTQNYVDGHVSMFQREPHGVVAAVTPWNFPFWQAIWKVVPALITGNTVVVKPSELTPLTTTRLGELASEVLPPGVLNVVNGPGTTGARLIAHEGVDLVSFTGSTRAGRLIAATAGQSVKPLILELGGNAPALVFEDADVEKAARTLVAAFLYNAGQECCAAARIIVHKSIAQDFAQQLTARMAEAVIGATEDPATTLGPMISAKQRTRAGDMLADLGSDVEILTGGAAPDRPGFYFQPTLVRGVANNSALVQEEIFAPVATLQAFSDESEALTMANSVEQGLASSLWTRDVGRAMRLMRHMRFGNVWINNHLVGGPEIPTGGFRQSGYGKEGGFEGIQAFTRLKAIQISTD